MMYDTSTAASASQRLAGLDHAHVWHPFTPMRQWREHEPLIIEAGEGDYLIDIHGKRYIDGVSSLWCNVHGHRNAHIDAAVRAQLDKIAHTTLLGLASPPSIELAAMLAQRTPGALSKTFYSDAGSTALELAFKMAVGYWYHSGKPSKNKFLGLAGAYHGDTTGSMSVGYSEPFHRPFLSMVFPTRWFANPDPCRLPEQVLASLGGDAHPPEGVWPSEHTPRVQALHDYCLAELARLLEAHADETAAIVIEPLMQGAAGMIPQPPGFLKQVERLARAYDVLLIADEVATGFGRTGTLFACEQEQVEPDILCLAKGISGGYLPLAATLCTDEIEQVFCGEIGEMRTLFHGHTYTGNPLACAAGIASLELFESNDLLAHIRQSERLIHEKLTPLRDPQAGPHVRDVRQRGIMVGIEVCQNRATGQAFDFAERRGAEVAARMRPQGLLIRPIGDVVMLMPIPAVAHETLERMLDIVVQVFSQWRVQGAI